MIVSNLKQKSIICLPVLNEEKAIGLMIDQIRELDIDFFISDGGSTDNSLAIAISKNVKIHNRRGKGKGWGIVEAIQYALEIDKEFIVFIDCDCTYPVNKIELFIETIDIENYDMVIGNRDLSKMTYKSRLLNKLLSFLIKYLFGSNINDPASGFRILRLKKFNVKYCDKGMLTEIEMSINAIKQSFKVKNIDIEYNTRVGDSKLKLINILKVPFLLLVKKII